MDNRKHSGHEDKNTQMSASLFGLILWSPEGETREDNIPVNFFSCRPSISQCAINKLTSITYIIRSKIESNIKLACSLIL